MFLSTMPICADTHLVFESIRLLSYSVRTIQRIMLLLHIFIFIFSSPSLQTNARICKAPAAAGSANATKWSSFTGRQDISKLGQLAAFLGNDTFHHFNAPVSILGSNDMYNFHPFLTPDEKIAVWEDLLMRPVEMEYTGDSSGMGFVARGVCVGSMWVCGDHLGGGAVCA